MPKNWCFWTVMLKKTLESPLDCKEINSVNPKGNQPWIFTGRTDAEAEAPILWPPHVKSWLFTTPWTAACQVSLSIINSWSLLKLMSIESVMPSKHFIHCWPLFLLSSMLPSFRVFSNELALCISWPKYWSFSFSTSPSNEYSGLISLSLRLTGLISLLSKRLSRVFSSTTVQKHQFFSAQLSLCVQLSHPYMTTGKTIALTRQTFVGKVASLASINTWLPTEHLFYWHAHI